jgi:outer membrane protein
MKRLMILVGVVFMSAGTAFPQTKVLTFEEAVSLAMKNGVVFNQQKNFLEISQMQKTSSLVALGPNINVNGSASRFDGNSFNNQTGNVVNGVRDNVQASINGNINVFSGFRAISLARQQANLLDAQLYNVNRTQQDLINTVASQYLAVMLDVELHRIAVENHAALVKQLEQVKAQTELGVRSPVDEYNQDAQTKAAELRMVQAEIQLNNDKATLSQTLLLDPFEEYDTEKPNWDINAIGSQVLDSHELAEKAKQFRGDYQRAIKQEDAQRFGMRAARGNYYPSVLAFASIGSSYNYTHNVADSLTVTPSTDVIVFDSSTPTGYAIGQQSSPPVTVANPNSPRPFEEQFRENNYFKQFGVQVQIPILNGFQTRSSVVQQKKLYDNAQLNRKNIEYQIQNDVIRTVRNFEGAKKQYSITIDQLKSAEVALQLETERYNLGVTNFVDFVNANRAYVQAEADKARAEYNLVFQKLLLEYAVGTLKAEDFEHQATK